MLAVREVRERGDPPERELDRHILERCVQGEPTALHAFVKHYQVAVFALLSRLLGRGPHVEDLAQDTFLRAFRALPNFDLDGEARPSTWLLTIGTRLAIDARRRNLTAIRQGQPKPPIDEASIGQLAAAVSSPERHSMRLELRAALQVATNALPPEQRDAFVLSEFHGLSIAEIGQTLRVRPNTVKTRLHRARQKLKAALALHHKELQ